MLRNREVRIDARHAARLLHDHPERSDLLLCFDVDRPLLTERDERCPIRIRDESTHPEHRRDSTPLGPSELVPFELRRRIVEARIDRLRLGLLRSRLLPPAEDL